MSSLRKFLALSTLLLLLVTVNVQANPFPSEETTSVDLLSASSLTSLAQGVVPKGLKGKIDPSLNSLVATAGGKLVKVAILTDDPNPVYALIRQSFDLGRIGTKPAMTGRLVPVVLEIPANLVAKIAGLPSVYYVAQFRLPDPPAPMDDDFTREELRAGMPEPTTWYTIFTHGAVAAWDKGYTGAGVRVADVDSGVDFAHPDLQGTQARQPFGPYAGWPIAYDSRSMLNYLFTGGMAFTGDPAYDIWYVDTSSTDTSGYTVTGTSMSGTYHVGMHPDDTLRLFWYGPEYVGVLLVDESTAGVYDTVYVDLDNDHDFTDEKAARKGDELAYRDLDGDGFPDVSGGMVYFIADGVNGVPYSDIVSFIYGVPNVIPASGSLVAFMITDLTEGGGDHGTLVASSMVAQGAIGGGVVRGMAPDAKVIAVGNIYQGGGFFDVFFFVADGYDGVPGTGDEADIVNMSFGVSGVVNDGWDFQARFIDFLTVFYAPTLTFLGATGNGGHGYGTVTTPGSAPGIIAVGAATQYWGPPFESIADFDQITWGDVQPWSNRGPTAVGQLAPDVVATGAWGSGDIALNWGFGGSDSWTVWGGTSMATPVAAGITALMYQAYIDATGIRPSSALAKRIMMASATDLGYDPLVQGSGLVNGDRATELAAGTSGLLFSPTVWHAGNYQGTTYGAFSAILHPGGSASRSFSVTNLYDTDKTVMLASGTLVKTGESRLRVVSIPRREPSYSMSRPLYVFDITNRIPPGTELLKASAEFEFRRFDLDGNYRIDNTYRLLIYDWKDRDGDGKFWNDNDRDRMVDPGEMESREFNRFTYGYPSGTALEARVQNPLERMHDGILLGIQHRDRVGDLTTFINIKLEFYTEIMWDMLDLPPFITLPAKGTGAFGASVNVPSDTPVGFYQGQIYLGFEDESAGATIPVTVNVAADSATFNFGGRPPSGLPNDNSQAFGGFDWRWRFESGDWRFFFTDIPADEVTPGTKLLVDLSWKGRLSDIDIFTLGPMPELFSFFFPFRYGPYALDVVGSSQILYLGSGRYLRETATGTNREIISADAVEGLHAIALHNVLYNGRFGERFSGRVGTLTIAPFPVELTSAAPQGTIPVTLTPSIPLSPIRARAFGLSQPIVYEDQTIYQDDPNDPMTSSYTQELMLTDAGLLDVLVHVGSNDLDLYLLYDFNGNGVPEEDEIFASSTRGAGEDDGITLKLPPDGRYWIFVHGWAVSPSPTTFDLDVNLVQGTSLGTRGVPVRLAAGQTGTFQLVYDLTGLPTGTWLGIVYIGIGKASAVTDVLVVVNVT